MRKVNPVSKTAVNLSQNTSFENKNSSVPSKG